MQISLVVNQHRQDAVDAAREAAQLLLARSVHVGIESHAATHFELPSFGHDEIASSNLVVAFGGDGTLIRAAHICSLQGTPILGVYFGRFGFVTQCQPSEIGTTLSAFFDGEHRVERRMMLQTDLVRNGQVIASLHLLNEAVLQRIVTDRMLTFEVEVNGRLLTRYPADGVMVSTATGSTGYNLSAGGPVLDPSLDGLILSALAPHTLSARPLVLSSDSEVALRLESGGDAVLSGDGKTRLHLLSGDEVIVRKSPRYTSLITVRPDDFLVKLSQRLFWSQSIFGKENE